MNVVGYHISNKHIIINSNNEICGKQSCLEFLLKPAQDTIRIMYDLDYGVTALTEMLHLTPQEVKELSTKTKLYTQPYHIRFVKGKLFSIKRPKAFTYYANAQRYIEFPKENLVLEPIVLAHKAKEIGEKVYTILNELNIDTLNLIDPIHAYRKTQIKKLLNERAGSKDPLKTNIINGIGLEIYGAAWQQFEQKESVG